MSDVDVSHARPARWPSLAEIFFGRLANLWRKRRAQRASPRRKLQFQAIEPRILLSGDLIFNAPVDLADGIFTLRFNSDTGNLELDGTGIADPILHAPDETTAVIINGEANQGDRLIIDFGFGGPFSVPGGITFNGGTGVSDNDELVVTGGSFTTATHTFTTTGPEHSGNIVYDIGAGTTSLISYTGLEPIDMSGSTIENLVFNLPGAADLAILEDDATPGNGVSQLRSQAGTFDTTTFSNPTSLTVNMGGDAGSLTVASPDATFTAALTINGQAGADTVNFTGAVAFNALSVTVGGTITDAPGTSLTVSGNARFSGNNITLGDNPSDITNFGSLTINALGNVNIREDSALEISGANLAQTLMLTAEAGAITDASDADITVSADASFTANGAGGAITLGNEVNNLDNFGRLTFNSVGAVSISEDSPMVLVGSSTASALSLATTGSITDSAATSLTVAGNARFSGGGGVTLGNDDTLNFGTLGFSSTGTVNVREDSAMEIAGVNTAGGLLLTAEAGAITDATDADIDVGPGAAILAANGAGGAITLGDEANNLINFGTITFNSVGHVSIAEDSASRLTGSITAGSLDFFSANQLTDEGSGTTMTVTGNARFAAGSNSPITLGDLTEVLNFGSLTFVATGTGAVAIREASATVLSGVSSASSLVLTAAGSITDDADADIGVTVNARFQAGANPITLGDEAGNVVNFGSLTFSGGEVSITEDSDTVLTGSNTAGSLSLASAGSITDTAGTSITVTGNASFSAAEVTLGENAADTTNFGSLSFNATGPIVDITEDSAMVLAGDNVGGTGAVNLRAAGAVTLDGDIVTRGGAVTIFNNAPVVLGSASTVTIDTTNGGTVPLGRSITITGTVNDDLAPTSLVLLGGTIGTVNLAGAVGGMTAIQGLTVQSGNLVALPAVQTREGGVSVAAAPGGPAPSIVLRGNIGTNSGTNAGNVSLSGSVVLGSNVQVNTNHAAGTDGNVAFSGTVNGDVPGRSLTINAGSGDVSFAGVVGGNQVLGNLTVNGGDITVGAEVFSGPQAILAVGNVTVAAGSTSAGLNASGAQTVTAGGTLTVQGGAGLGLSARIVSSGGQTIDASSILVAGGSLGDSSFAEILQTGALGIQTIDASSITITGGLSGTNNFARIRNDATDLDADPTDVDVVQTITGSPVIEITGGTGGAPDLGNFAQILAAGRQVIEAGHTTLAGGVAGASNSATIESPNQDITVHGNLTLTGGGSVVGTTHSGGSRIGGLGGDDDTRGPTNLTLTVDDHVTLTGGNTLNAAAVIGNSFQGNQTTDITMDVGGNLTLNPGTVPNSAARIGSPSAALGGGDITITVDGDVTFNGTVEPGGFAGTVIRTADSLTLEADNITIHGGAISSGEQTITALGDISVMVTGANNASVSATGLQTITAGGNLTLQGASSGLNRSAQIDSSGGQDITAAGIVLVGGSGGTNNFADIRQTGLGAAQEIEVTGGGTLSMQGGLGGVDNFARIRNDGVRQIGDVSVSQQISFPAGGSIELTGGNGPAVPPDPLDTGNNFARIENRSLIGLQTITTGTIALNGGITGANNFTGIQAAHQDITTTGDVTLHGGPSENSGSRIGAVGDTTPTDVTLIVGGSLTLTGSGSGNATIGANRFGGQPTDIHIEVDDSFIANGVAGGVRIGSPEVNVAGGDIEIHAGIDGTGDILFTGRAQLRTLGEVTLTTPGLLALTGGSTGSGNAAVVETGGDQTIEASAIELTGGSVGNSNFAQIYQTGALGKQTIDASSITIEGGASGADNFARIRNDGTGDQTIEVTGLLSLTGGAGGAPDQGNFAQIRAVGHQEITAGNTTITAGGAGFSNFAGIHSPDQDITINGNLTLTGGSSVAGPTSAGGARIGGIGGGVTGPTNLMLSVVGGSVTMTGGSAENAGAVIGSSFQGGQPTDITMDVGGNITLGTGTAPTSSARIGAPNVLPPTPLTGGTILITAGGNITLDNSEVVDTRSVIRTVLGSLTLNADNITVGGSLISATQTINAIHNVTVAAPNAVNVLVTATGLQTITAGGALTVQGGAGTGLSAQITSSGGQSITASEIAIVGGSDGINNFAEIRQFGIASTQTITVTGSGNVTLQGGLGGLDNFASIRGDGVSQTIAVNGGAIALTGGNGPDVAVPPDTSNNFARIQSSGSQTINADTIALNGALSGINSFTTLQAPSQLITTTGNVTLSGGLAAASNSGSRIGSISSTSPTNLVLNVGGDLVVTAGSVSGANLGAPSGAVGGDVNMLITVSGDFIADGTGGGGVRIGSPEATVAGGDIEIHAGLGGVGDIVFSGRAQLRTLGEVTLTTPGTLSLTGGSTGSGNAALIESNGNQTISAHTIELTGGLEGALDLGNFARITSVLGQQTITAGSATTAGAMTLTAGASGFNNYASITGPNQVITVHGDLTLTGGGSAASLVTGGGARIGGLGGAVTGPTNLTLIVGDNVIMKGGTAEHAGAVIGSNFLGGQPTEITMDVGGNLTLRPGTVANSGSRIGSPSAALAGGNISIDVDGDITLESSLTPGVSGTVIRTLDSLTMEAATITIGGQVTTGAQTVTASGGLIVKGATSGVTTQLSATGGQTINAKFVEVIASGGSALIQNTASGAQSITTTGMNAAGEGLAVRSLTAGTFARIGQEVNGGEQEINVTNANRLSVEGMNGIGSSSAPGFAAEIRAITGTQTITVTGTGDNAIVVGSTEALASSVINALTQDITAGADDELGSISIFGPKATNRAATIVTNTLLGIGTETQTIATSGTITVVGGTSPTANSNSGIFHNRQGLQSVTATDILIQGGSAGTGNGAFISALNGGDQLLDVSGSITLTGGSGSLTSSNRAGISILPGGSGILASQTITGNPTITLTGGASGGVAGAGNTTFIDAGRGTQTIDAGMLDLKGGTGGTDNGASITAATQIINVVGDVLLTGSTGSGNPANARIGAATGVATNLTLDVGGDLVLKAGSVSGANLGATSQGGVATRMLITVDGDFIADGTAAGGVRIGSPGAAVGGGDIEIHAGAVLGGAGDIVFSGNVQLRTLGNVTLNADGTISEDSNGVIQANALTTTSDDGTTLAGPNQVAVFNATNTTSGNVTLVDADGLTVTGISNPVGDISVSITGQMTVTGSLDSGTHDMSLTAPGGVVFTDSAVVNVDLAGIDPTEFTNITISGAVTLDGTLDADVVPGFSPVANDRFRFMTFASQSGSFDATNLPEDFVVESFLTFLELVFAPQAAPTISINDVTLLEGNSGTTSFTFTASLSNASAQTVTVNFATADGTATLAGNDYQGAGGTVTFAPGQTSQLISVLANGDVVFEPDETFTVNLSGATNAAIADGTGLGTIVNDDNQPAISINDVTLLEGNSGTTSFTFTASLSNASAQAVTVNFATADGTATLAGNDYQGAGGTVTFAPGQTSQTISVLANGDVVFEADETFTVNLSGATNAVIADGTGLGTIRNDDAATGGIDLVGAVEWNPDDLLIPGDRERVTVVVTNEGDTAVHDQVTVKLYASTDDDFDEDSDVFLDESHTGSNIQPGGSKSAQFNVRFPGTLLPGEYFLLAVVDPDNEIEESNELNNTAIGDADDDVAGDQPFDFRWMFGQVPGHGRETLTVRDDDGGGDGTWVNFSLLGPGTGEITIDDDGKWDLVVTGTTGNSILSILTLGGGDHRVELDDIHITGALRGILAPKMDLTGTLAIDGALGAGMMIGSATDAVIAVEAILGTRLLGLGVQGIAILGDLEDSEILIGADLGADGQLGGSGANADTYSAGDLGDLLITGSMISSSVRVGQDPVDETFDNGDDVLLDGSIDSITILGDMTDDSFFVAEDLPRYARIHGEKINTATDPRFWDSLPADLEATGSAEGGIDWNAQPGAGWGAGYSPFGSRAGQSNFSDFLMKIFG